MSQVQPGTAVAPIALIAVGSNAPSPWGPALATVQEAIARVEQALGAAAKRSAFYQTPAFPAGAGPDFVNAAFAIATRHDARAVLDVLHGIEAEAARERTVRWGQRTLDLDLIALGNAVLPDLATYQTWQQLPLEDQVKETPDQLILPHPRVQDRAFVLGPLMDVAPNWVHPVSGLSVGQMWEACPVADRDSVVAVASA